MTNGHLDTVIDWIPVLEDIRSKDLPSLLRTTNPEDIMVKFVLQVTERARKASAIILNTFKELDRDVFKALSSYLPPIYCIGPLNLLQNQVNDESLKELGSNLWKEEPECLEWLNSKEPNSVVYVNFGSITVMTADQLVEFAWGLANGQQTFLWIIRPDLFSGDSAILPVEFLEETKERSLFASWCPQEEVLSHPSVPGFLTHSGWNSTIENNNVKRDEVESLVKELMVGEKGKDMKKNALEWKNLAEVAARSSNYNLENLIHQVLLNPKN
ncbi:hypothetical protein ACH5RR_026896 [Cinchona calisaya]|uniref:Uncharacterized protein n=1 Tax=Cinchona calisaya TaxID=153742 RepID=A0ABD2Z5U9_9GENT